MAEYKGIKGFNIQTVSSDPPAPFTGEVWFNSTSGTVKYSGIQTASFSSGGNMATARKALGGTGTETAALGFAGYATPGSYTNITEEYNGSSWTNGGNMATARVGLGSAGTQTAGLGFGGQLGAPNYAVQVITEEYDGSSWTNGGNLTTARKYIGGCWNSNSRFSFWWYLVVEQIKCY